MSPLRAACKGAGASHVAGAPPPGAPHARQPLAAVLAHSPTVPGNRSQRSCRSPLLTQPLCRLVPQDHGRVRHQPRLRRRLPLGRSRCRARAAHVSAAACRRALSTGNAALHMLAPQYDVDSSHSPSPSREHKSGIDIEIGTPERTRAWTLGAVGWASRISQAWSICVVWCGFWQCLRERERRKPASVRRACVLHRGDAAERFHEVSSKVYFKVFSATCLALYAHPLNRLSTAVTPLTELAPQRATAQHGPAWSPVSRARPHCSPTKTCCTFAPLRWNREAPNR